MTKDTPPPSTEFHPALSVTNIKNCVPLILDRESVRYSNWEELFCTHAEAYKVLDHIDTKTTKPTDISEILWKRLDAIVRQWIYGTISSDLLDTILCKGDTAQQVWDKLKNIFQDNKTTRALYLENQFNDLHLSAFSDVSSYCKQLKSLKDQLANVDQPISDQKLVLRLIAGLRNTDYDTVAAILAQTEPLPSFESARSRLLLEETRCSSDKGTQSSSFVAQQSSSTPPENSTQQQQQRAPATGGGGGRGGDRGRGRGGKNGGKGRGRGTTPGQQQQNTQQPQQQGWQPQHQNTQAPSNVQNWANQPQWPNFNQPHWPQGWAIPPAPFPTSGQYQQRPSFNRGPPQQAYTMGSSNYGLLMSPTEFNNAYSSMTLPNPDNGWYMDSGATSHMTNNAVSSHGEGNNEMQ